jgi:hypothetical protein
VKYQGASFIYSWGIYAKTSYAYDQTYSISFSSDGSFVLAQIRYGILILSASSGDIIKQLTTFSNDFSSLSFPCKSLIMNSAGTIVLSGERIASF